MVLLALQLMRPLQTTLRTCVCTQNHWRMLEVHLHLISHMETGFIFPWVWIGKSFLEQKRAMPNNWSLSNMIRAETRRIINIRILPLLGNLSLSLTVRSVTGNPAFKNSNPTPSSSYHGTCNKMINFTCRSLTTLSILADLESVPQGVPLILYNTWK